MNNPKLENKPDEVPKKKNLWVDVTSGNRLPTNGITLGFTAPKIVDGELEVEIETKDVESELFFWDLTLIMYTSGKDLSMNVIKQFMTKFWNFVQLPDMFYHEEGYFIHRFNLYEDRDQVVMKGPYTIHGVPMVLKEWYQGFDFKRDMLRTLPKSSPAHVGWKESW